jgi:hypothetical protein
MRRFGRLYEDDSGTSVMVEYILAIVIMSMFFSLMVLVMNSMINNSDQIVVGQELGIVANDVANRISGFSQMVNASNYNSIYLSNDVSTYNETIDLPDLVGGKPYTIVTDYDGSTKTGTIKVSYGMNSNVNRSVSFRTAIPIAAGSTISSSSANPKIYYDPNLGPLGTIQVVGY